jgi:hypothetical protein
VAEWLRRYVQVVVIFDGASSSLAGCTLFFLCVCLQLMSEHRWYSVVVSISGCDPLDPGSNPGTANSFLCVCNYNMWCTCVGLIAGKQKRRGSTGT